MSLPLAAAGLAAPVLADPVPADVELAAGAEPPPVDELELLHAVAVRASSTASPAIINFKTRISTQPLRCSGDPQTHQVRALQSF
jgi:hypothetical protein